MLTYCVRGERFSAGPWGAMIDGEHVRRLLECLAELPVQDGRSLAELLRERAQRVAILTARVREGFHRCVEVRVARRQVQSVGVDHVTPD